MVCMNPGIHKWFVSEDFLEDALRQISEHPEMSVIAIVPSELKVVRDGRYSVSQYILLYRVPVGR